MIEGLGIDILANDRLLALKNEQEFTQNVFTRKEIGFTHPLIYRDRVYAIYFSVKEAILKALGCGLRFGTFWRDVEIDNYSHIKTHGNIRDLAVKKSIKKIHTTSASTKKYALSVVLLESENYY
jgi:holo-[acyl-carrier-protein] synthase